MSAKLVSIIGVIFLSGCVFSPTSTVKSKSDIDVSEFNSTCDVALNPDKFVDKIIKVYAVYTVVKNNASFFEAHKCAINSVIAEGSLKYSDNSVLSFNRKGDIVCRERKISSLCTLKADVFLKLSIRKDSDGNIIADPIHIYGFSYRPQEGM